MGHQLAVADFPMETSKRFYRRHPNELQFVHPDATVLKMPPPNL
jgi:hypothetical protein